jgi:hypothetical protein
LTGDVTAELIYLKRCYALYFYSNKSDNTPTYTPWQKIIDLCGRSDGRSPLHRPFEIVDVQHLSGLGGFGKPIKTAFGVAPISPNNAWKSHLLEARGKAFALAQCQDAILRPTRILNKDAIEAAAQHTPNQIAADTTIGPTSLNAFILVTIPAFPRVYVALFLILAIVSSRETLACGAP